MFKKFGKYGWFIFLGVNLIVAVLVALGFSYVQDQNYKPRQQSSASSSSSSDPTLTPTPGVLGASSDPLLDSQLNLDPPENIDPVPVGSSPPPPLRTKFNLHPVINSSHWVSWAVLDMKTGTFAGSQNWNQPTYLMSMIKPWIAADYLNEHPNPSTSVLGDLSNMIVNSDDQAAYQYFGGQPSWDRFVHTCGITDIVYRSWSWSLTQISARDAVRYGYCVYSGKATNAKWTAWIVDKMRHVKGDGDFGPRLLFQDKTTVATKNGWYNWQGKWYVNCLAATDNWVISTLQQWPYTGGDLPYGISLANPICKSVANDVLRLNAL